MLDDEDEPTEPDTQTLEPDHQPENTTTFFQLSPQALTGQFSPRTLKLKGVFDGLTVSVLVDTGNNHNILQPRIANHLHIPHQPISNFSVMVGNVSHLHCAGFCSVIPITLQSHLFHIPFYLFPIQGVDVVLGMEWLQTLGPINADFSIPKISFTHDSITVTLTGDPKQNPTQSTYTQLRHLMNTDSIALIHLLTIIPTSIAPTTPIPMTLCSSTPQKQPLTPKIQHLLQSYPAVFAEPHGLPPARPHDHHIPLIPNTHPVNVKPYHYPHSQKEAMITLIQDMLREGTIIPSNNPYSSPVLLVRKKDGSWRFCMDYRALSVVIIHACFLIPTIDELFDELGSASVLTKIDLRSGYHQIRVVPEDTHKIAFRTFDGHYEFLVMPFGLSNAPSTFQSAMNDMLRPYLRRLVLVFFDDILIYSHNLQEHMHHLRLILDLLASNQFVAKFSKCVFAAQTVDYLGHIISPNGVSPNKEKIQAILSWVVPYSLTTLHGFL